MALYAVKVTVEVRISRTCTTEIEADSKEAAEDLAHDDYAVGDLGPWREELDPDFEPIVTCTAEAIPSNPVPE